MIQRKLYRVVGYGSTELLEKWLKFFITFFFILLSLYCYLNSSICFNANTCISQKNKKLTIKFAKRHRNTEFSMWFCTKYKLILWSVSDCQLCRAWTWGYFPAKSGKIYRYLNLRKLLIWNCRNYAWFKVREL